MDTNQKLHQEEVWDNIADSWQEYKKTVFGDIDNFLKDKKGKILDLCCGSGRNFSAICGEIYGIDFSKKMLEYARKRAGELNKKCILKKSTAEKLPFENDFFDSAIFVASLHCIESAEKRKKALEELIRVLKPEAQAFITVWSKNHRRINKKTKDQLIPWTVNGVKYDRYYYVYSKEEFEKLLKESGFKILEIHEDENIIAVVKKTLKKDL